MALPPEPLDDVLPSATTIVVAEVIRVDDDGAWPPGDKGGPIDGAAPRPAQRVQLKVTKTLRTTGRKGLKGLKALKGLKGPKGPKGPKGLESGAGVPARHGDVTIDAHKPPANYALRIGTRGAFLLDDNHEILGRYGPDTWSVDEVEAAVRA